MRGKDLIDSLGNIDDKFIEETTKIRKKRTGKIQLLAASLAIIILTSVGLNFLLGSSGKNDLGGFAAIKFKGNNVLASAEYPEIAPYPFESSEKYYKNGNFDIDIYDRDYDKWSEGQKKLGYNDDKNDGLESFYERINPLILSSGQDGENIVYSPVNIYMATSILAEVTGGSSQDKLLNILGADNINILREMGKNIWGKNYQDDGRYRSLLATSLWLNNDVDYNKDLIESIKSHYYTSSFKGQMGSEEYNDELRNWLNLNTLGLMKNISKGLSFKELTTLGILSTIYLDANWDIEFDKTKTHEDVFYLKDGEEKIDFMTNKFEHKDVYFSDEFMALNLRLKNNAGKIWFFLPNEGFDVEDLFSSSNMNSVLKLADGGIDSEPYKNQKYFDVNFYLPKFDLSNDIDLKDTYSKLGLDDLFVLGKSDFGNLTKNHEDLFVSDIKHGARIKIDEEGVEAAAFTAILMEKSEALNEEVKEIDFRLNKPFIFVLQNDFGQNVFVGLVNNPAISQ